ncbi:hypothetical protein JCM3775_000267 [Rhodotorula graminis]|uniref:Rab-GAP TBC domain-containing protein n=1 Tax=Rhodotorula graminis (strain WP1) TaxID=578459 RepID=A0A194S6E0_RHOGW|nr:uncharacterized protein RHOBADRAFT_52323 [Rhodotorula graminis WP1]KPV76298.1 hypothetical protein RHOBADRAFT_52323 [Rhodotorula graminis WP1]
MSSLAPAHDIARGFDSVSLDDDAPPASSSHPDASLDLQTTRDNEDHDQAFESVSLDSAAPPEQPHDRDDHRSSPSPSSASTPPHSPSLASTAPTTVHDPSSSTDVHVPPRAPPAPLADDAPVPSTSAPSTAEPDKLAAAAAAPSPKKLVSTKRPTIMQKVVSMTRQRDLPPKPREEEEKHLTMLAEMYAASREADKHRREAEAHRAAVRAAQHAAAFPAWEASILPNWRVVLHDTPEGRRLRQLWRDGTMPTRWRGRLWAMCIGNGLAVPKGAFAQAGERAARLRDAGRLAEVERAARADAQRTLPALHMFQEGAVMHDDLMEILVAWAVYEKTTPRYPDGLAFPAALLLLNLAPAEAFVCLVNLVQKSFLRSFYGDQDEIEAYYRVFDTLLADAMPKIYANFSAQVVRPSLYLLPWLSTLFAAFLPLDLATRVFDCFLLEGDSFPFRVALVLLDVLEPRLFNPNLDELAAVFRGTDRGALGVVRRDKGLILADGSVDPDGRVETDEVYAEMGATEERVFEGLARLEWKEETWARLVERELPEVV